MKNITARFVVLTAEKTTDPAGGDIERITLVAESTVGNGVFDEANNFAQYNPDAVLAMTVTNPEMFGRFSNGKICTMSFEIQD